MVWTVARTQYKRLFIIVVDTISITFTYSGKRNRIKCSDNAINEKIGERNNIIILVFACVYFITS